MARMRAHVRRPDVRRARSRRRTAPRSVVSCLFFCGRYIYVKWSHLVKQLGTLHTDKARLTLIRNCFCEEGLSASRGSPQEYASWRVDTHCTEDLRSANWLYYSHVQFATRCVQRTNVCPGNIWNSRKTFALR